MTYDRDIIKGVHHLLIGLIIHGSCVYLQTSSYLHESPEHKQRIYHIAYT
jgi:hypothetical protein